MDDSCEYGNDLLGSIKGREYFWLAKYVLFFMRSVNIIYDELSLKNNCIEIYSYKVGVQMNCHDPKLSFPRKVQCKSSNTKFHRNPVSNN
jgi:hypothetical protein